MFVVVKGLRLFSLLQAFAFLEALSVPAIHSGLPQVGLTEFERLLQRSDAAASLSRRLEDAGGKIGAFAITDLPEAYQDSLEALLADAPGCLKREQRQGLPRIRTPDGSFRTTFATESGRGRRYPPCINMDVVSGTFDRVEAMVAEMIEKVYGKPLTYAANGTSDAADLKDSPFKDHVHVYERAAGSGSASGMMVPYHTDNGMFLVITPFPDHGLEVELSDGNRVSTKDVDSRSVLVLVGRGLTEWLFQPGGYPDVERTRRAFHPVPHAVKSMTVSTRTVYARMKVAAETAVPKKGRGLKTFGEVFMEVDANDSRLCAQRLSTKPVAMPRKMMDMPGMNMSGMDRSEMDMSGMDGTGWKDAMKDLCKAGGAYCWMGCMDLPSSCPSPAEANCYNDRKNLTCRTHPSGQVMDPGCRWHCKEKPAAKLTNDFCYGAMSMYMKGFEPTSKGSKNCVVLFFEPWVLDTRLKFGLGCLGVFCMGLSIEIIIMLRRKVVEEIDETRKKMVVSALLFATNIFLGYMGMLAAMTYSIELFTCLLLGLVVGHAAFNLEAKVADNIDPCCAPSHHEHKLSKAASRASLVVTA